MESFDIPDSEVTDSMTVDQASEALKKLDADSIDNPEHPRFNTRHPQHESFQDYETRLFQAKHPDTPDTEADSRRVLADYQRGIVSDGQKIMDELGKEGFETSTLPDDLHECERDALKAQLMLAKGRFDIAAEHIDQSVAQLQAHSMPANVRTAWDYFKDPTHNDFDGREEAGTMVLKWILEKQRALWGITRKGESDDE